MWFCVNKYNTIQYYSIAIASIRHLLRLDGTQSINLIAKGEHIKCKTMDGVHLDITQFVDCLVDSASLATHRGR